MTRKGKQAGVGAGMLGGGGVIALYGVGCLIACAIIAISGVVAARLAALIVGAALLAVAAAAALLGEGRLQRSAPPVPEQAVARIKTDVDVINIRGRGPDPPRSSHFLPEPTCQSSRSDRVAARP